LLPYPLNLFIVGFRVEQIIIDCGFKYGCSILWVWNGNKAYAREEIKITE
jgi:hypothetical protein